MSTKDEKQAAEYRRLMGSEALERQQDLAATTCPVCFGRHGKHSQLCPRARKETKP